MCPLMHTVRIDMTKFQSPKKIYTFFKKSFKHIFEPLSHNMMIEIQKNKLSHKFAELFIKYLES